MQVATRRALLSSDTLIYIRVLLHDVLFTSMNLQCILSYTFAWVRTKQNWLIWHKWCTVNIIIFARENFTKKLILSVHIGLISRYHCDSYTNVSVIFMTNKQWQKTPHRLFACLRYPNCMKIISEAGVMAMLVSKWEGMRLNTKY